jgi:hypothetical protein
MNLSPPSAQIIVPNEYKGDNISYVSMLMTKRQYKSLCVVTNIRLIILLFSSSFQFSALGTLETMHEVLASKGLDDLPLQGQGFEAGTG